MMTKTYTCYFVPFACRLIFYLCYFFIADWDAKEEELGAKTGPYMQR